MSARVSHNDEWDNAALDGGRAESFLVTGFGVIGGTKGFLQQVGGEWVVFHGVFA